MIAVVLTGGQSARMGTDKGLLKRHADTWAQTAIDKLNTTAMQVVLSINKNQLEAYSSVFPTQKLIVDSDSLQIKGPLCGLLSVHLQFPQEDLLILACDMPLMDTAMLKELTHQYLLNPDPDAFVFLNGDEPEPLCAVYKASGLAHIMQLYHSGGLTKYSMKFMLDHINTHKTSLPENQKTYFRNFNAHAELNGL
jgi:molybdopterin-guanine dinucleotide biosynthesis protein A